MILQNFSILSSVYIRILKVFWGVTIQVYSWIDRLHPVSEHNSSLQCGWCGWTSYDPADVIFSYAQETSNEIKSTVCKWKQPVVPPSSLSSTFNSFKLSVWKLEAKLSSSASHPLFLILVSLSLLSFFIWIFLVILHFYICGLLLPFSGCRHSSSTQRWEENDSTKNWMVEKKYKWGCGWFAVTDENKH